MLDDERLALKERKLARQMAGLKARQAADATFYDARCRARAAGLELVRHSDVHYALIHPAKGWLLNVFPGNGRICADYSRPRAPYLAVPRPWTLADVVAAAVASAAEGVAVA